MALSGRLGGCGLQDFEEAAEGDDDASSALLGGLPRGYLSVFAQLPEAASSSTNKALVLV